MKSKSERLGDRHLRGIPPEARREFLPGRIRIVATRDVAAARSGQITLWFLANLLARQFEVVRRIEFVVSDVELQSGVALFAAKPTLVATLTSTVRGIADDSIEVSAESSGEGVDLEINIAPIFSAKGGQRAIGIWGTGWRCAAGSSIECGDREGSDNPIGSILAACLGAAEAFRCITDWKGRGREIARTLYFSAWDGRERESWQALGRGEWQAGLTLPPFYLVGSGAVGQALAATLGLCSGFRGHVVVLDRDPLDDTNFNRYCLAWLGCGTSDKTQLSADAMRRAGLFVDPIPVHLEEYLQRPRPRTESALLNTQELEYRFPLVVSCVDKNPARHSIQNLWPRLIFGGSTDGLSAKVMRYDVAGDGECLKCANPITEEPTIEAQAKMLKAMTPDQLAVALAALPPADQEAVRRHLKNPKCGEVAATLITEMGRELRREFAVGFVSVGAGALLAAALIQHAMGRSDMMNDSVNQLTLSFQSCRVRGDFFRKDGACDCTGTGTELFQLLWSSPDPMSVS